MQQTPKSYDVIVLGAGAAGLMAAATAGQRGKTVALVDHATEVGKKILISGGGRCNFTNLHTRPECFLSQNPHFAKSALGRYTAQDFIDLVNAHNIAWHEKTLGQLFCNGSAKQIVKMLLDECAKGEVHLVLSEQVSELTRSNGRYTVTVGNKDLTAPSLVVATGGLSIPKMGATGFAYDIARQFGLRVVPPRPALVPFILDANQSPFTKLTGLSAEVIARCGKAVFREAFLFTHKGLSGPAILQVSSYWTQGDEIAVNFLPDHESGWLTLSKRTKPKATLQSTLAELLPGRLSHLLSDALVRQFNRNAELANMPDRTLEAIEQELARWQFKPNGTEGYAKAEVTAGGVDTAELSSKTMEARQVPGLYFIGEAVDVTGWLGGYNFQWAWSSAHAAAQNV